MFRPNRTQSRISIARAAHFAWLVAVAGASVWAAPAPPLEEITVTGRRDGVTTIPDLDAARAAAREIAGGVSVLDAAEFRVGRAATPEDALQHAPGVFVASRFGAEESRLSIRGSGLQRTFHGRGIMFLQDGVPLNLADGGGDFQAMEPLAAQYVEVFRGANALRYGSTTLGGAVNFVSPSGRSGTSEARLEGGSFGYQRLFGSLAAAGERVDAFVSGSHYAREGFQRHSEQSTQRLMANVGFRTGESLEQRVYLAAVRTDSELPGSLTRDELRAGDVRRAAPGNVTGDNKRDFDLYRLAYRLAWAPTDAGELGFSAFYSAKELFHPIFQVLEQDSDDAGVDLRWSQAAPFARTTDALVLGVRAVRGETRDDRFVNVGGQRGARTDQSDQRADHVTAYGEYRLVPVPDWAVIAGLQYVTAERRFDDLCHAGTAVVCTGADASFDQRYAAWVPRIGVLRDLTGLQLFANLSRQYEPPSFGELSGGPGVDLLDAQEGTTIEIGGRGRWEGRVALDWDVALYWMDLENELLALQVAPNTFRTINADDTRHRGVELGVAATFTPRWHGRLTWQYNDFRYRNDATYGDNHIAGVPEQVARGELTWQPFGETSYVTAIASAASSSWVDHVNRVEAPGYAVWSLRAGGAVSPALSVFVEARNLTDKVYAATHGVVGDATLLQFGQPQRLFNPGDGRAFYAGVTWRPR
ncbi:MAG: TonB-dependent receptor [Pseudomonadales bacterium]|nr:TonB-dependent receptor [Pseudomonadales bacterium]